MAFIKFVQHYIDVKQGPRVEIYYILQHKKILLFEKILLKFVCYFKSILRETEENVRLIFLSTPLMHKNSHTAIKSFGLRVWVCVALTGLPRNANANVVIS